MSTPSTTQRILAWASPLFTWGGLSLLVLSIANALLSGTLFAWYPELLHALLVGIAGIILLSVRPLTEHVSTKEPSSSRLRYRYLIDLFFVVILFGSFFYIYANVHAFGATSGDSPGYIFNAGRLYAGEDLVFKDPLVEKGLNEFGDAERAEWLAPRHSSIANGSGAVVSKYPVGISLLMSWTARLTGSDTGFYVVVSSAALLNVLLLYVLCRLALRRLHRRTATLQREWWLALGAAITAAAFGISDLVLGHAVAHPLRDIPATTFLLAAAILLYLAFQYAQKRWLRLTLATLASALLAFGFNIRHTLGAVLPGYLLLFFTLLLPTLSPLTKKRAKAGVILLFSTLSFLGALAAFSPTIRNTIHIQEVRDIASIPLSETSELDEEEITSGGVVSNADHVKDLSTSNLLDNQGKFRPGRGSMVHYATILQSHAGSFVVLLFVVLGLLAGIRTKETRLETLSLLGMAAGTFFLFSLWINPYSRYVIPSLPFLFLFGYHGAIVFFRLAHNGFSERFTTWKQALLLVLLFASPLVAFSPRFSDVARSHTLIRESDRPISRVDLETIKQMEQDFDGRKTLLVMDGRFKYGTSELIEAHTDIRAVRLPDAEHQVSLEEVISFLRLAQEDGYTIAFWTTSTDNSKVEAFLEAFPVLETKTYWFTFAHRVTIFQFNKN